MGDTHIPGPGAAPDAAEPIFGWRVWVVSRTERYRLWSVVHAATWEPGEELRARCQASGRRRGLDHPAPDVGCQCGLYAVARLHDVVAHVGYPIVGAVRAVGIVALWGSVIEHERGWRSSHAYPARIWLPRGDHHRGTEREWERMVTDLRAYGVPVEQLPCSRPHEVLQCLAAVADPSGLPLWQAA